MPPDFDDELAPPQEPDDEGQAQADEDEDDAGEDDSEGDDEGAGAEDDAEEGEGDDLDAAPEAKPALQPSRSEQRIRKLAEQNKAIKRELEDIKAGQYRPPVPQGPTPEQIAQEENEFNARLELMTPAEAARAAAHRAEQRFHQHLNQDRLERRDKEDKSDFREACRDNETLRGLKDEVEARRNQIYRENPAAGFIPREAIAKLIAGERFLAKAPEAKAKQQKRSAAANARQQGKPGTVRSGAPGGRDQGGDAFAKLERKLANQRI